MLGSGATGGAAACRLDSGVPDGAVELLTGTWRWQWRFGRELLGSASIALSDGGLFLTGRRVGPVGGPLWLLVGTATTIVVCSGWAGAALTAIGVAHRTQSAWPFLATVALLGLGVTLVTLVARDLVGRLLAPRETWFVPFDAITRLAVSENALDLAFRIGWTTIHARCGLGLLASAAERDALESIRVGKLVPVRDDARFPPRPQLLDWTLNAAVAVGIGVGLHAAWVAVAPELYSWWPGRDVTGGVPPATAAAVLEAERAVRCDAPSTPTRFTNRRDGLDLAWEGPPGELTTGHLRLTAGSARAEPLVALPQATSGRLPGVLDTDGVTALSVLGTAEGTRSTLALISTAGLGALRDAWCAGLVRSFDMTGLLDPSPQEIDVSRDGDDLVIDASRVPAGEDVFIARPRWLPGLPPDLDTCELAVHAGELRARPWPHALPHRVAGYFGPTDDGAIVFALPKDDQGARRRLAAAAGRVTCLEVRLLRAGHVATAWGELPRDTDASTAAAEAVLRHAPPQDGGADAWRTYLVDVSTEAFRDDRSFHRTAAGLLGALPWTALFETHRMDNPARLLAHADTLARVHPKLGEAFLFALTQAFVERIPVGPAATDARLDVADAWLARDERLSKRIGRFLQLDAARHFEDFLNEDAGLIQRLRASTTVARFERAKIAIDIRESSRQKALTHWLHGDFEYVLGRVAQALIGAAPRSRALSSPWDGATMQLGPARGLGPGSTVSELVVDGRPRGRVALFDLDAVELRYTVASPTTHAQVPRGAVAFAAAAYVTGQDRPVGLAFPTDGGDKNDLIADKMDGLVVIPHDAPPRVLDLRRGGRLPHEPRQLRPLRRLSDLSLLLTRIEEGHIGAFQTHALVVDGEARIDRGRADSEVRERRLLVLAEVAGRPVAALIDLPGRYGTYSLYDGAALAEAALEQTLPNLSVQSIVNLDTGQQDVFYLRPQGGPEEKIGPVALAGARNLIAFVPR